jgi:hypothetical protein
MLVQEAQSLATQVEVEIMRVYVLAWIGWKKVV